MERHISIRIPLAIAECGIVGNAVHYRVRHWVVTRNNFLLPLGITLQGNYDLSQIIPDPSGLTPLMRQYWGIKKDHPDKILLFRMGDFYEMFYRDAEVAAPILNIALTSRNKKSEDETPMCGMPHHSISTPISKLLAAGLKVAICDQLEDPATAKGIVQRGVTRILTPGMVYDPETLDSLQNHYTAAFDKETLSYLDASTGEAFYFELSEPNKLRTLLTLIRPAELLVTADQQTQIEDLNLYVTQWAGEIGSLPERFRKVSNSGQRLLAYARDMQGEMVLSSIADFVRRETDGVMTLTPTVCRHLEIFLNYRGEQQGTLFHSIDRTKTAAGARLLKRYLQFPLLKHDDISRRQDRIQHWMSRVPELKLLRQSLAQLGDVERRLSKISYANCQVRDLVSLKETLDIGISVSGFCPEVKEEDLHLAKQTVSRIASIIVEDPPLNTKVGGYIRHGVDPQLDEYIQLTDESERFLVELEARERSNTEIPSLKVRYNNVFGYYIEITNTHRDKVPDHYKRKQTLANAERYMTQELMDLETKILSARSRRIELEQKIFADLRDEVLSQATVLLRLAGLWSDLDVLTALAWLALEQNYCRPTISDDGTVDLIRSRHPVVEMCGTKFVANDVRLERGNCLLLTGPNMAGKSTLMRQVALSVILHQVGSFVPAGRARLPIFENLFTRIGASDSLTEGLSTFMVEMKETAEMLKHSGRRTLVVLDEVGRGTSTYDGMSLAQAILEFLVCEARSTTFFATHYHELVDLARLYPQVSNAHMGVAEKSGQIQFLYTLKAGPANKSYGIQVAQLAGLPDQVVRRAGRLLKEHEAKMVTNDMDLPLLAVNNEATTPVSDEREQKVLKRLRDLNIVNVTPVDALNRIAEWQQDLT